MKHANLYKAEIQATRDSQVGNCAKGAQIECAMTHLGANKGIKA
jgi:hypothetical protein